MATFISTDKFERWWRKAQAWFATQFASINIDTTELAKQGNNTSATNTAIYDETINNGSLLDQSIAAQLYAIIGEEEESES